MMLLLVLILIIHVCSGQETVGRLPTDAPLEGTKQLEMNVEYTVFVRPENNEYYLIRMPSSKQPLHLYITPCNRPVHWTLRVPNKFALGPNVHPSSKHFNHVLHMRIPPLIEFADDLESHEKLILLAGEENEKRMEFFASSIEADYIVLNMSSSKQTTAKVFATTLGSQLDAFYPKLPKDSSVTFSINRSRSRGRSNKQLFDLHLKWPVPEYTKKATTKEYRFCVLASKHQPQYSICEKSNEDLDSMHCVAPNIQELVIKDFEPSERYYVTVFLHNMLTEGSSAYFPIEFTTPFNLAETSPPPKPLSQHPKPLDSLLKLEERTLIKRRMSTGSSKHDFYSLLSDVLGA